jgi:two-component sensor histidine kinase
MFRRDPGLLKARGVPNSRACAARTVPLSDEFIAILSHELRNPLAPIRYALPVFERETLSPTAGRALTVIHRQVDHLARLVDDLLDVSRITRGTIELRREHVALAAVVNGAAEAASSMLTAARHEFRVVVPDEPIWLYADAARITQVLTNLLNNSAKYTPRGGRVVLEARREEDRAVIEVRDNGMGIPPEALPTVFDMFRQVNRPEKSQGGLGIGLGLVERLVKAHGGTIEAHSAGVGRGASFVVRLPLARDGEESVPARPSLAESAGGRRLRVLVVDDNADLVEMLGIFVEAAGHEVRKALDGRSAVSAAVSYRPDVVLLDLGLPLIATTPRDCPGSPRRADRLGPGGRPEADRGCRLRLPPHETSRPGRRRRAAGPVRVVARGFSREVALEVSVRGTMPAPSSRRSRMPTSRRSTSASVPSSRWTTCRRRRSCCA